MASSIPAETRLRFKDGNRVRYFQDFSGWLGMPTEVTFTVAHSGDRIRLTAPGYGGKPYGNGAIYIWVDGK